MASRRLLGRYTPPCASRIRFCRWATLCASCISYNGTILKKNLQAEAIRVSSHLFYCPFKKVGTKVMEQLRKALKIAEACITSKPENLYVLV